MQALDLLQLEESMSWDEVMLKSEEMKPTAIANITLCCKNLLNQKTLKYHEYELGGRVYGWSEDIF